MSQLQLPLSSDTRFEIASHYPQELRFLMEIQAAFSLSDRVLQQKRNTIKEVQWHDEILVVKAFKVPNLLQGLIYRFFRVSKAARSFHHAKQLLDNGINTHHPIAYAETFSKCRLRESFFVSSKIAHDFTIRDELNKGFNADSEIIDLFTQFTFAMHRANILHLDHTPGNTLITKTTDGYQFSVIDINRMKFQPVSLKAGLKNLSRLTSCPSILETMANSYAQCANANSDECLRMLTQFCTEFRRSVDRKARFKQLIGRKA